MRMADREYVEGTESPRMYIFHRVERDSRGDLVKYKPWHVKWCLGGEPGNAPLKTTNRSTAIRMAIQKWDKIRSGDDDLPSRNTTIDKIWTGYIDTLQSQGRAPRTLQKYDLVKRNFLQWARGAGKSLATRLDEVDFFDFRRYLIEDLGVCEKTAYDRLVIVKQAFNWAGRRRLIGRNPFAEPRLAKPESAPQPCFTPEQVGILFANVGDHYRPIFTVLAYTGMRIGELSGLCWSDVLMDQKVFSIRRGGSRPNRTKTGRSRFVPMHEEVVGVIKEMLKARKKTPKPTDLVFHAQTSNQYPDDRPVDPRRALIAIKRLCKRCGFENSDQYKLHTFRHFYASMLIGSGTPVIHVEELLGHKSSQMTRRYVTMYNQAAHAAVATIKIPVPDTPVSDHAKKKKKKN